MSKPSDPASVLFFAAAFATGGYQEDVFNAGEGMPLKMTFFGHSSLMFTLGKTVIHVDPVEEYADYAKLPKADLVVVTHEHFDHFSTAAISMLRTPSTEVVLTAECASKLPGATVLRNGETKIVKGLRIEAIPAYNIVHMRSAGMPFHPKGSGNGYVFALGRLRVYVAGDTENTPEMKALTNIDVAFLPMNLPYTMTPEMVADAVTAFRPRILYPYHTGNTDTSKLTALLARTKDVEVRIRSLQ